MLALVRVFGLGLGLGLGLALVALAGCGDEDPFGPPPTLEVPPATTGVQMEAGEPAADVGDADGLPGPGSPGCLPLTCGSAGRECGLLPDGCGGVLDCGACGVGLTCGGGGAPNTCGIDGCVPLSCGAINACGLTSDGCGGVLNCGDCPGAAPPLGGPDGGAALGGPSGDATGAGTTGGATTGGAAGPETLDGFELGFPGEAR